MSIGILNCKSAFFLKTVMKVNIKCKFDESTMILKIKHNKYNASMCQGNRLQTFKKDVMPMHSKMNYSPSILHFKLKHNVLKRTALELGITNEEILKNIDAFVTITKFYIKFFNEVSTYNYLSKSDESALILLHHHQTSITTLDKYKQVTWKEIFDDEIVRKLTK